MLALAIACFALQSNRVRIDRHEVLTPSPLAKKIIAKAKELGWTAHDTPRWSFNGPVPTDPKYVWLNLTSDTHAMRIEVNPDSTAGDIDAQRKFIEKLVKEGKRVWVDEPWLKGTGLRIDESPSDQRLGDGSTFSDYTPRVFGTVDHTYLSITNERNYDWSPGDAHRTKKQVYDDTISLAKFVLDQLKTPS